MPALPSVTAVSSGPALVEIETISRSPGTSQKDNKWCVTLVSACAALERECYYDSLQIPFLQMIIDMLIMFM